MKNTITLPTIEMVEFELIAEVDTTPVRGNAQASGNDALDRKAENAILKRLENDDMWGWASVEVKATYRGFQASNYLGGCSYDDESDFKADPMYQDMKREAFAELIKNMEGARGAFVSKIMQLISTAAPDTLSPAQLETAGGAITEYLESSIESAESLYNPDAEEDEQPQAVVLPWLNA